MKACFHEHADSPIKGVGWAFGMTAFIFVVELVGGWWTGSLALIADSLHMAVDLIALGMTLFASIVARRPPDTKRTFGYKRIEVLAALGNGVGLWVATGIILHEAYSRFMFPVMPVAAPQMLALATVGLACNLFSALMLFRSSRTNINLRGAFFHVISDAMGSISAIVAGIVIYKTRWYQADSIASIFICIGIVFTSYWLLRDSIHILLEGAPAHLDIEEIRAALQKLEGVKEVHDLHLWSLTQGSESMSGHLVIDDGLSADAVLKAGTQLLKDRFRLSHVTLQIEK